MLHFGKWNWGNSTKKYYGKFEKMAFRKSHEKGVEAQKFFPIERKIWGRTTPKMKFLLKFLALPEGGGVGNSCKNCRNRFFRTFEIFNSKFTAGSLLKIFGHFSAIFAEISDPPPSGRATILRRNFIFGVVRPQIFLWIGKNFWTSTPFPGLFEKPLFWTFRKFFSPNSLNFLQKLPDFLQKLQEILQFGGWTNDQMSVPRKRQLAFWEGRRGLVSWREPWWD